MIKHIYRGSVGRDGRLVMSGLVGAMIDATDPDLRPFLQRGGKLLMCHGWDDAAIPAGNMLRYHDAVGRKVGKQMANVKLFMLPGVAHCSDGRGPDQIDFVGALDRWSESGVAPEQVIAAKHDNRIAYFWQMPTKIVRSRPVCHGQRRPVTRGRGRSKMP